MSDSPEPVAAVDAATCTTPPADAAATRTGGRGAGTGAPIPEAVGRFRVLGELARGGMGVVYRARDPQLDREVAVKVLADPVASRPEAARRFLDEARITGQLQHPSVPPVHEAGELPDGRPFLVMKLIKGRTLDELLKDRPDPAADRGRLLAVFEQVCHAVAYAHARGVVHRDLKPHNVMVGAFGEVQVMDWGLAKVLGEAPPADGGRPAAPDLTEIRTLRDSGGSYTLAGSVLGTPAFMPPEQAGGETDKLNERADVFGLGAVLCVILTGKPPYVARDAEAVRLMAIRGQLDDCLARLDMCGAEPELVALCKRCLSAEPPGRPADAQAVVTAVSGLRAAAEDRARRAEVERAAAEVRVAEQRKRRKAQAALGASFTALVGLGVAFAWWQDRQAADRRAERERAAAETRAAAEWEVNRAVEDAVAKFGRATGADRDLTLWAEARAAALQAADRAAAAGSSAAVRDRVHDLLAEIEQVERNRRLVGTLLEIHAGMGDTLTPAGDQDFASADARYARAFRDYGIDLFQLTPGQGADLLRSLGGNVQVELAAAIDDWGYVRYYLTRQRLDDTNRLFGVTRLLDPDPLRNQIRDIVAKRDRAALGRLAAEIDPTAHPVQTVNLVAVYLYWFQAGDGHRAAGQFLRRAQPHHPGDFQINHNLAFFLSRERQFAEALPFCLAAIAVRPRSPTAWQDYAIALAGLRRNQEAAAATRRVCSLSPTTFAAHFQLVRLLNQVGDREGAAAATRDLAHVVGETIRLEPKTAPVLISLAWLLAVGPDGLRDGKQAVELATRACELNGWKEPTYIGTLAAAYAEAGDFDRAIEFQKKALTFPAYQKQFGPFAGERLSHFARKQPYRDPTLVPREVGPPPREVK